MLDEGIRPGGLGGRGTTDTKLGIHALDGSRGVLIKLKISGLPGLTAPEIKIRLVPDLKIPLRNLPEAITLNQMPGEGCDHGIPLVPVLGRRNIRPVPEGVKHFPRRQFLGHEAQLDEWL